MSNLPEVTMRVVTLIGVILVGWATAAAGQERQIGAKAGPSFGTLAFEPDEGDEHDRRIAADGGGFAVLPMTKHVGLQLEALFNSKGAKLHDPEENLTSTILLQYFDIPVLVRVNGPRSASRSFHLLVGPYAGVRLSAKRQLSTVSQGINSGIKTDMSSEIERSDIGFVVGGGVDIGRRLVVDGRYLRGLSALNTDKSNGFRIRNRGISIMAGARF